MVDLASAVREAIAALGAEAGCSPQVLTAPGVHLFERPGERTATDSPARRYPTRKPGFTAVSLGYGTVVSARRPLLPVVETSLRNAERDQVFEVGYLAALLERLRPFNLQLYGPYLRLVCGGDTLRERLAPRGCHIIFERTPAAERLRELGPGRWPHAISVRQLVPTTALAVAYAADSPVGVAAMSADSESLWQIGIDVAEQFRGQGLGAALTSTLGRYALQCEKVPWYGVAPSNLASLGAALAAGFRPAWTEVFAAEIGR